jgi:hypothetical protein
LQCTVGLFVPVPFSSLASLGAHAVCILCCALDDESLYFDERERESETESFLLLVLRVYCVIVGSNGGSAYLSSSEDGEAGGFASPCVGAAS